MSFMAYALALPTSPQDSSLGLSQGPQGQDAPFSPSMLAASTNSAAAAAPTSSDDSERAAFPFPPGNPALAKRQPPAVIPDYGHHFDASKSGH